MCTLTTSQVGAKESNQISDLNMLILRTHYPFKVNKERTRDY